MKKAFVLILLCTVYGCASTGVIPLSENTFIIAKRSGAGAFADMGKLKAAVIREANEYAAEKGMTSVAISLKSEPASFGRQPFVEYQFRLVDKGTSQAKDGVLKQVADVVVENKFEQNDNADDKYERLRQIGELRSLGILTEEEFQLEKTRILSD